MAGYATAFFNSSTTQRAAPFNFQSQAQPTKPIRKTPKTPKTPEAQSPRGSRPHTAYEPDKAAPDDRMLPTPLLDYKHAANQTFKARAAAAQRKSGSHSAAKTLDRKHVSQADPRAAARDRDPAGRTSSISSNTASSGVTAVTSDSPDSLSRPYARYNGRTYLRDTTLPYPLPCDLAEIHRQTLRTMLLCQVFNGPLCSPAFEKKPPKRVLDVGCGTGFWSVMCYRHFAQRGTTSISFTGLDIAPMASRMDNYADMNWRFVQHDMRKLPLPFRDDEFSLIMVKDVSMVMSTPAMQQEMMDEYIRILKPGGTIEIWDGDHTTRMLLSHSPPTIKGDGGNTEDEEQAHANAMGIYTLTTQTPLAAPLNQYLLDCNVWIAKALEARRLTSIPCTLIQPILFQEAELIEINSRRLAIPLGEVRWEREGIGGAASQGENGIATKGKAKEPHRKVLTSVQAAVRRTALMTVVQMIESLEPVLRDASGKGQDEWDRWQGSMMNDLLKQNGSSWGECLEVGAWWARKKKPA